MTTGPVMFRRPSAPMPVRDLDQDLKQQDLVPPSSELMGPEPEQALAPEPAWAQRAWTRPVWERQPSEPQPSEREASAQQPLQQAWARQAWARLPWAQ